LISKSIQPGAAGSASAIRLTDKDELAFGSTITFSVHAQSPETFSGRETIDVGDADGLVLTTLSLTNGLVLEDAHVALATLDTAKAFNASTFGALQFRIVEDGAPGEWQRLGVLVRLPVLRRLKCPAESTQPCELSGQNLFLIDSLASDAQFDHPVKVPEGFTGYVLQVPHPTAGRLYVRLRDDAGVVETAAFPA
jgi:hypothetical protein